MLPCNSGQSLSGYLHILVLILLGHGLFPAQ